MSYEKHMRGYKDPRTFCHIDRLYAWKNNKFFAPATVEISPINICNQKCRYCYVHTKSNLIRKNKGLEKEIFIDIIKQCKEMSVGALHIQGTGEPLLHRGIVDAFHEIGRQNLPVYLTTNGVLLDKKMAREILPHATLVRFSNFEPEKKRYTYMHDCPTPTHYDEVVENIENAVMLRNELNLDVALTSTLYIDESNFERVPQYIKQLKSMGLDYVIVGEASWTSQTFIRERRPSTEITLKEKKILVEEISQACYKMCDNNFQVNFTPRIMPKKVMKGFLSDDWKKNSCQGIKFTASIASDGEVYPCWRFWGNKKYSYGNLYKCDLRTILQGQKTIDVFNYINTTPPEFDECEVCSIMELNNILGMLKNPTVWHNFLSC